MNKRFAFKLALAGAAALMLTACGEKEAPKAPAQSGRCGSSAEGQ